ncbi:MAG: shikimate dehydrogenase [Desulfovibrionaceae bacterium]|nr:shikimate dehydrogenase [Desulfovibrionaceae bacterium]
MSLAIPFIPEKLFAVIGYPLEQTLSPLIHNTAFQVLKIPAIYLKFTIAPIDLPKFVQTVRTLPLAGCSVTIPHKQAIIPYLDSLTLEAKAIGAVNTLFWEEGKLVGENTDCLGFLAPLESLNLKDYQALILGAGGASRALIYGLKTKEIKKIYLTTPSNSRHLPLAQEFDLTPLPWEKRYDPPCDLIINATPLGMLGKYVDQSAYDLNLAYKKNNYLPKIVYDIVYNPLETKLLREAKELGISTISGFRMFLAQANAQFKLWTKQDLPLEAEKALREALLNLKAPK